MMMSSASIPTSRLLRRSLAMVKAPDTEKTLSVLPLSLKNLAIGSKKTLSSDEVYSQERDCHKKGSTNRSIRENTLPPRHLRGLFISRPLKFHRLIDVLGASQSERSIHTSQCSKIIFKAKEKVNLPDGKSFFDHIFDDISDCADKPALIDGFDGTTYTYAEAKESSMKLGLALVGRGYQKGDVVAILSPNAIEYPLTVLGCAYVGITVALLNPLESTSRIQNQISETKTKALFVYPIPEMKKKVAKIVEESQEIRDVIVFGFPLIPDKLVKPLFFWGVKSITFATLLKSSNAEMADGSRIMPPDPDNDVLILPFSSGTTGRPKAVVHTHSTTIAFIECMVQISPFQKVHQPEMDSQLRMMSVLPMFHIFGYITTCGCLRLRGTVVMYIIKPPFDEKRFLKCIQKHSLNFVPVVPNIIDKLANSKILENYDHTSLRFFFSSAAPLNINAAETLMERIPNLEVKQGLGMTEALVSSTFEEDLSLACSGRLCPNSAAKVVDPETSEELGHNDVGEIVVQTPTMMKGYLNNPEANAQSFLLDEDGTKWLRTGDVGYFDESNVLHLVDRIKEMIKYKGNQVSPVEIESEIRCIEGVTDAAVVGIPDLKAGEIPIAFVVKSEGSTITGEEVQNHIRDKMNSHDRLRGGVVFIEANPGIPRSPAGKILRRELKKRLP